MSTTARTIARVDEDERSDPLARTAPELEGEVAAHRDADGDERAVYEGERTPGPGGECRLGLRPREVRRRDAVARALERVLRLRPHAAVEREGVQEEHSRAAHGDAP